MYLWQIRHIPNLRRILFSFSAVLGLSLMLAWVGGLGAQIAQGQGDAKPQPEKKTASKGPDPAVVKAATDYIKQVHDALYARTSIKADIEQTVTIGAQQFQVTGQYVNSGQKLRLEYNIEPAQGVAGSLLEVCDGKELWTLLKVANAKPRVTHRDVQQIKAAAAASKEAPDVVLTAELGLGGLTALLASIERTMVFDAMKEESEEEGGRTIVQGRWKPDVSSRWPRSKEDLLPDYIPDLVRLWIDPKTQFPVRIVYIKRVIEKEKKVYRPMVSLTFKNIQFDTPVSDQEFTFVPPDEAVPEDVTRQFLDRMKKSSDDAAAPEKPVADPAKPRASK